MKQTIKASITGKAGSVDAAAADLKSKAADLGLTPDWATLELEGIELIGTTSHKWPLATVRATCHGEVEVPE